MSPCIMNKSARIYLDDSIFEQTDSVIVQPDKPKRPQRTPSNIPFINTDAVQQYKTYFKKMLEYFTFELVLFNGESYYVFSKSDKKQWMEEVNGKLAVEATRYLDKIQMEPVTLFGVKNIRDVTQQVRDQYFEQHQLIYNSYQLVEQIMEYSEDPFVQKMIQYVLDCREGDESKRKFWRVVNEKYYGLDIHPLMEYELEELEKILYYCQHPEERRRMTWQPVIQTGAFTAGTSLIGWLTYLYLISK